MFISHNVTKKQNLIAFAVKRKHKVVGNRTQNCLPLFFWQTSIECSPSTNAESFASDTNHHLVSWTGDQSLDRRPAGLWYKALTGHLADSAHQGL